MAAPQSIQHDAKECPRCGQPFECKTGSITECQCFGIQLPEEVSAFVADKYADCLCRACLLQLQNKAVYFQEKFRSAGKAGC
ncbi:MAG TPA: cysteine-rich CWC family protein [Phnomibacter sp.]|nr:cysteine-rich CWC family protein [Phnomibacter sp.]